MTISPILVCVVAGLFITALGFYARRLRSENGGHAHVGPPPENSVDITLYAYGPDICGLDDIRAKHIGAYRDTGVIAGFGDDQPVYSESFLPTRDSERELGSIVRSASEVKRLTDKTVVYFFNRIRPLTIRSNSVRAVYDSISQGLSDNRPMVLRMTRKAAGEWE